MSNKTPFLALFVLFIPFLIGISASGTVQEESKNTPKTAIESKSSQDTIEVTARLLDIPNKMPPNDLYNYVFIVKYRVISVEKGDLQEKEILVGQYNPLIPRDKIKDKMDEFVSGDVTKFSGGQKHKLVLTSPLENIWKDAVEDEYEDDDEAVRYFALKTDLAK